MSENWIHPVAFQLGGRNIYWYGIWVAIGFLAAVLHWTWLARRDGKPAGFGSDFGFLVMFSGALGSRLAYVLMHWSEFAGKPADFVRVDKGGLIFFGGFALAVAVVFVLSRIRRVPFLSLLDYGVVGLSIGHAIGRIGCFFNGCCYGAPSDVPWACLSAGELRHPVQLYEMTFNVLLWIFLTRLYLLRRPAGTVFAFYLIGYGTWRFAIEFLRSDTDLFTWGLHTAQVVSLALVAFGAGLRLLVRGKNA